MQLVILSLPGNFLNNISVEVTRPAILGSQCFAITYTSHWSCGGVTHTGWVILSKIKTFCFVVKHANYMGFQSIKKLFGLSCFVKIQNL